MPEATPKNLPRIISKADAAAYCGTSIIEFHRLVVAKSLPDRMAPTWGWDKVAFDRAFDRLSGIDRSVPSPKPSGLAEFL